jgi:CBS domain-containing protein
MNVASILKTKGSDVATAPRGATLAQVAAVLANRRIGAIVIVDGGGHVEGIVSERDIIKAIAARGAQSLGEPASEIMTRNVVTCQPGESLDDVMATMTSGRFRHVPVVENGRLAGIVSIGDAVKHHIAEVEQEADALKSYVLTG